MTVREIARALHNLPLCHQDLPVCYLADGRPRIVQVIMVDEPDGANPVPRHVLLLGVTKLGEREPEGVVGPIHLSSM